MGYALDIVGNFGQQLSLIYDNLKIGYTEFTANYIANSRRVLPSPPSNTQLNVIELLDVYILCNNCDLYL